MYIETYRTGVSQEQCRSISVFERECKPKICDQYSIRTGIWSFDTLKVGETACVLSNDPSITAAFLQNDRRGELRDGILMRYMCI